MCRSIRPLFNYEPQATEEEMYASALQYVRKVSGFQKPSVANQAVFETAVAEVFRATKELIESLVTSASPKDRAIELARTKARAKKRFG